MIFYNNEIKGAIFDIDGTLLDSMGFWNHLGEDFIRDSGRIPGVDIQSVITSMSFDEGISYIQKNYFPDSTVKEIRNSLIEKMKSFYQDDVALIPGTENLLNALQYNEIPMICATAGYKKLSEQAFERLNISQYFKEIVACSDLNTDKTKSLIFTEAMKKIGLSEPEQILVFEDSEEALKTAKMAGFITVGVGTVSDYADYFVNTYEDIVFSDTPDFTTAILVGASEIGSEKSVLLDYINDKNLGPLVIAVDGGIRFFLEENIAPHVWIGDMDSSENCNLENHELLKNTRIVKFPPEKDDTDMALAVKVALENNCDSIFIFGAEGGKRSSHTYANIQLLHYYSQQKKFVQMISENTSTFVLCNGECGFPPSCEGYISILSLSDVSKNVKISGFKYEFSGDLKNTNALGVSNEFVGKNASISVENGALLIVEEKKINYN